MHVTHFQKSIDTIIINETYIYFKIEPNLKWFIVILYFLNQLMPKKYNYCQVRASWFIWMDSIKDHRPPSCHDPGVSPAISLAGQSLRLGTGWAQILIPDPLLCRSFKKHLLEPNYTRAEMRHYFLPRKLAANYFTCLNLISSPAKWTSNPQLVLKIR